MLRVDNIPVTTTYKQLIDFFLPFGLIQCIRFRTHDDQMLLNPNDAQDDPHMIAVIMFVLMKSVKMAITNYKSLFYGHRVTLSRYVHIKGQISLQSKQADESEEEEEEVEDVESEVDKSMSRFGHTERELDNNCLSSLLTSQWHLFPSSGYPIRTILREQGSLCGESQAHHHKGPVAGVLHSIRFDPSHSSAYHVR